MQRLRSYDLTLLRYDTIRYDTIPEAILTCAQKLTLVSLIIAMKRDQSIAVLCLCESWHDEDSVSIRRLRAEGLQVLERARPRSVSELSTLSTNHGGGVAIAASRSVRLTAINTGNRKRSFEHVCARVCRPTNSVNALKLT